jgi:hypothetical protein
MGNGFTFELQSLLFYAAVLTVFDLFPSIGKDRRCRVYGDDIILPTAYAGIFVEFLSWLGFTTNPDKSFVDGPFRESCGKHYFLGDDVTPFYIRENVDKPQKIFWFHNQYILWLRRAEFNRKSLLIMREEFDFLLSIRSLLPEKDRKLVPFGDPDDVPIWAMVRSSLVLTRSAPLFGGTRTAPCGFGSTRMFQCPL